MPEPPKHLKPPPPGNPKPPAEKPPAPTEEPDYSAYDTPAPQKSSVATWAIVVGLCAAMTGGVYYARPYISGEKVWGEEDTEEVAANDTDGKQKKKKRKKRKRRRKARKSNGSSVDYFLADDDEEHTSLLDEISDDDLPEDHELGGSDRFRLGEVFEDHPDEVYEEVEPQPREKFVPPPEMYNPKRGTRSSAVFGKKAPNAIEISMSTPDDAAPLQSGQITNVLTERRLMSCYDDVARKVPEMKGRVNLSIQIDGNGRVNYAKVTRSELRSNMVENCIVKRVSRMRFPKSKGGQRTRFSTHFDFD